MSWPHFSAAVGALGATVGVLIYLLPLIIANLRQVPARYRIMVVNLGLGWTVLGWIGALVWALRAAPEIGTRPVPVWPMVATAIFTLIYLPGALFLLADSGGESPNFAWFLFPVVQFLLILRSMTNSAGRSLGERARLTASCALWTLGVGFAGGALVDLAHRLLVPGLSGESGVLTVALFAFSLLPAAVVHQRFWQHSSLTLVLICLALGAGPASAQPVMDNFVLCDGAVIIGPTVGMLNGHRLIREATGICVLKDKETESPSDNGGPCWFRPIDSVETTRLRFEDHRLVVTAEGKANSAGWKYGTLVEQSRSHDAAEISYEFQACPPFGFAAQVMSPILGQARSYVDEQKLRRVIIVAARNSQTLEMAEFNRPLNKPEQ